MARYLNLLSLLPSVRAISFRWCLTTDLMCSEFVEQTSGNAVMESKTHQTMAMQMMGGSMMRLGIAHRQWPRSMDE